MTGFTERAGAECSRAAESIPSAKRRGAQGCRPAAGTVPAFVMATRGCHNFDGNWAVSSAVEHCFHTAGVTGSIPVPPTTKKRLELRCHGFCGLQKYTLLSVANVKRL
jgi:hypothetical protein